MGEVISNKAAADDIFADVETIHARAAARGGKWQQIEQDRFGMLLGVLDSDYRKCKFQNPRLETRFQHVESAKNAVPFLNPTCRVFNRGSLASTSTG